MTAVRQAKSDPGNWAELTGMCAKALGRPRSANPYRRQSDDWRRWRAGHVYFTVSREAMKRPKLGRGRSKLGPRREWTAAQDATLLVFWGEKTAAEIGVLIGKTGQACRNRMHRIRKEGAGGHDRP